jgi:four helix bundle protein
VTAFKTYEEIVAWQLSVKLRDAIGAIIARPAVARDFKFCDQIRDSAASPPRNIAEGFGRYQPRDFGHFLDIAYASLMETKTSLQEARSKGYLAETEYVRLVRLTIRASKATLRLRRYLRTCPPRRL